MKRTFTQWLLDVNLVLQYFFKIIYENSNLFDLVIGPTFTRILNSFRNYNHIEMNKDKIESYLGTEDFSLSDAKLNLLNWLNYEFHPKILNEDVLHTLEAFNYQRQLRLTEDYQNIESWLYYSKMLKNLIEKQGENALLDHDSEDIIKRYFRFVENLIKLIDITF